MGNSSRREYVSRPRLPDSNCLYHRQLVKHIGLNYMFRLNEANKNEDSINSDGARAGNETRYINHPPEGLTSNVRAKREPSIHDN